MDIQNDHQPDNSTFWCPNIIPEWIYLFFWWLHCFYDKIVRMKLDYKSHILHSLALGKGHVCRVLPVTSAKVPILKCVDRGTGVECDISVENRDGIMKSRIIRIISSIDERFQKLSFLVKLTTLYFIFLIPISFRPLFFPIW